MTKKSKKICPKCGSLNWNPISSNNPNPGHLPIFGKSGHPDVVECNDCGFTGVFPEVEKDKIKEVQKQIKTKSTVK